MHVVDGSAASVLSTARVVLDCRWLGMAGPGRATELVLREFGREKLTATGSAHDVRARHTAWFVGVAEQCAKGVAGPDELASSAQLEREFENCREAHGSALAS